jgi:sporulation protein YlmC with PRC-barrel domain
MKRKVYSNWFGLLSLLLALTLTLSACEIGDTGVGVGEDTGIGEETGVGEDTGLGEETGIEEDTELDEEGLSTGAGFANAQQGWVTASSLLDYDLTNLNGENMGEIEDLLLNMQSGQVRYATIEYGGVLDIGDREIAVPLNALNWNSAGQLGMMVDEQQLANYPELGEGWADASDPTWDDEVFNFWNEQGVEQAMNDEDAGGVTVWASDIVNTGIQDLGFGGGMLNDLLIDPQQGRVQYAVVRYEPGLLENELVAVPIDALNWQNVQNGEVAWADGIDQGVIEQAPPFAPDALSGDVIDQSWDDEFAGYWEGLGFGTGAAMAGAAVTEQATETPMASGAAVTGGFAGVGNVGRAFVLGSDLLDYDFDNIDGQVSGEIEDVIFDAQTGQVLFATVEYGGFLEIGDTELALPLNAFTLGPDGGLVLAFDEAALNDFPDVGTDWLNAEDPAWDDEVGGFWRNQDIDPGFDYTEASQTILRLSELTNYGVSDVGFGAGVIEDVVVALGEGRAKYLLLSFVEGGTFGEEWAAVPFSAFDFTSFENQLVFAEGFDQSTLENAPRFESGLFADGQIFESGFDEEVGGYWTEQGYDVGEWGE